MTGPLGKRIQRDRGIRGGAGYLAKLLVNLLWFGQAIATAEAPLLARRAGLDLDVLRQALASSAASSAFIRGHLGALLAGDYLTSFGLDRCYEELAAATALGREHDVPFELSALVERIYQGALARYGRADGELLAVALLEEQAGIKLSPAAWNSRNRRRISLWSALSMTIASDDMADRDPRSYWASPRRTRRSIASSE